MKDLHYKFKKVSELCTGWIPHSSQTAANRKLKENLSSQSETIHYIQGNSHLNDYKTSHQKSWGWEHNRVTSKCWKEGEKKANPEFYYGRQRHKQKEQFDLRKQTL